MLQLSPPAQEIFKEAFHYARGAEAQLPTEAAPVVVFGRSDALVAKRVGELVQAGLAEVIVITGGVGKDTGDLISRGYRSEAHFLSEKLEEYAREHNITLPPVLLEEEAKNGGENARNSLEVLAAHGYLQPGRRTVTAVAHAISARRLAATLQKAAQGREDCAGIETVAIAPTGYTFNPNTIQDRTEVAAEIMRIDDFANNGFGVVQPDLPSHLVTLSKEYRGLQQLAEQTAASV